MSEIYVAITKYVEARDKIIFLAHRQYSSVNCPLNLPYRASYSNCHKGLAQALWGLGCYGWECEFCGEEFTE